MTNAEVRNRISNAPASNWFQEISETFDFHYVNFHLELKGVSAIYEYVNQQLSGWEKLGDLPDELKSNTEYFNTIRNQIIYFVTNYTEGEHNLAYYWQSHVQRYINGSGYALPYDIPEVDFLIKVYKSTPSYFKGAYGAIVQNSVNHSNKDSLYGVLLAYEFALKDHTEITQRRKAERESISKIRNDFQQYLSESEAQLVQHLKNADKNYNEYVIRIDELKSEKETLFTDWFEKTKTEEWHNWFEGTKNEKWHNWFLSSTEKVSDLENTYKQKLKLEEPAKYWSQRADNLKTQGWWFLGIMVVLVFGTCWSLGQILWSTPEQIYSSWFGDDKSAAIRWSIIYVTLISFIAFCIRALTKVMFSSFHLARDCEERYTLTYFYLSLLKDSQVDEKDRQLIMQSLFSRAETGLLKDDSSPTMPNDMISKVMSK
ncbi:DUF6161 domain-containing protein [Spirosoma montaniterrae]|uniref:DUF6161 domain-containing protein n=1 Tax=Spirosoma montaniterrae TaxID=1178516 RepID=A0A1P9WYH9_9BACT|nr:DUF6161 domain-containing protein [Spirosoma montaniterrae]AQG80403.1 hypothetical protein AWR27_14370 [Spirosoma montaniterrae]